MINVYAFTIFVNLVYVYTSAVITVWYHLSPKDRSYVVSIVLKL